MGGKNKKKIVNDSDSGTDSEHCSEEEIKIDVPRKKNRRRRGNASDDDELTEMLAELDLEYNKKQAGAGKVADEEEQAVTLKKNAGKKPGKKVVWANDVESDGEKRKSKKGGDAGKSVSGNRFANMMDDDVSDGESAIVDNKKKTKGGKKDKKKNVESDDDDTKEEFLKKKAGKNDRKKKGRGSDDDDEDDFGKKKASKKDKKRKGGDDSDGEEEFGKKKAGNKNRKKGGASDDDADEEEFGKKKGAKKDAKKKKGGAGDDDDDDDKAGVNKDDDGVKKGGKKDARRKGDESDKEEKEDGDFGKKTKSMKKDKKKKRGGASDDEDEVQEKKSGSKKDVEVNSDGEDSLGKKKGAKKDEKKDKKKKKGGDSDDDNDDKTKKVGGDEKVDSEKEVERSVEKKDVKQKKGRKKRDDDTDDDELENMLAELASEYNVDKKMAAGKKKEVVEEEKVKKEDVTKEKGGAKKEKGKEKVVVAAVAPVPAPVTAPVPLEKKPDAAAVGPKDSVPDTSEKTAATKTPKGLGKKAIAALQETARKLKEEEEQRKREQEQLEREEEERERQFKLKKEQELKEKKKRKERKERLKAEGKYLTPKQKADAKRAQQLLDSLRAQGVRLPSAAASTGSDSTTAAAASGSKSKVVVYTSKLKKKPKNAKTNEPSPDDIGEPVATTDTAAADESDAESEDDVKDAWDAELSDSDDDNDDNDTDNVSNDPNVAVLDRKDVENYMFFDDVVAVKQPVAKKPSKTPAPPPVQVSYDHLTPEEARFEKAKDRIRARRELAEQNKNADNLRAPIICVLGHVDTGKTKILDRLRRTNVQDGEAGGITQQIGATNVPAHAIIEQAKVTHKFDEKSLKVPGLLIIDTPGHESFGNLRSRGSSLCDIAILVVDIMHGLEPQTLESIELLKSRKTPFVVALNKIDRLYNWKMVARKDVREVLKAQDIVTKNEFKKRSDDIIVQFAEQKLNARMFYDNADYRTYIQVVPTSAITGEGMGNLLAVIVNLCQAGLSKRLMYSSEIKARVLEVKAIAGLGTTIDVVLVNGVLNEGDTIVLAGTEGPFATQIRSLLMPEPMRELRVKSAFIEHKQVRGAQGVKITGKELEKAIAGLNLLRAEHADDVDVLKAEIGNELKSVMQSFKVQERGVYVQASTLGSLEALLEFLKTSEIPYCGVRIGPVAKRDVMKASVMLEHNPVYATILAFDVKIERDAQEMADSVGVKIFQADIIYHLFDKFVEYQEKLKNQKRDQFKHIAVFPCKLKILPQFMFNTRDPIVCGVMVEAGILQIGTPLCVPTKDFVDIGIVSSIESSHKPVEKARKGEEVCVKIEATSGDAPKMFGRHFDETDFLVSKISRPSIDACKEYFRDDLTKADWQLMIELKKTFSIL